MKCFNPKLLIAVFCFASFLTTKAQVQVSAGPEVGFTAAGLHIEEDDEIFAGANLHFGGTARIQFGKHFAIRPSVLLKLGNMSNSDYDDVKVSMTRISVPIPILYSHLFGNNSNLFVGAGPNLMYSLSGKIKSGSESIKIPFGSNSGEWKPLDVGLHLKGGFQFPNGLALSTFANFGFTNLANDGNKIKTLDAFGLSIGYMFGGRED